MRKVILINQERKKLLVGKYLTDAFRNNANLAHIELLLDRLGIFARGNPLLADVIIEHKALRVFIVGGVADPITNKYLRKDLDILFNVPECDWQTQIYQVIKALKHKVLNDIDVDVFCCLLGCESPYIEITDLVKKGLAP